MDPIVDHLVSLKTLLTSSLHHLSPATLVPLLNYTTAVMEHGWFHIIHTSTLSRPSSTISRLNIYQHKGRHHVPFLLFFYKVYKRPLTPPPRFIKLRCKFFENTFTTFSHWIWFPDIQNRFFFIVKRLKNPLLMYFYCLFSCPETAKTEGGGV